jgi:cytidylate kinase
MTKDTIITIGRQYGSGGREIGRQVAKELSIPFYDRELIKIAAEKSGIDHTLLESNEEKPSNSLLYSLVTSAYSAGSTSMPLNDRIFLAQFDAIKSIAQKGPCVIVGRCADYVLEERGDCVNLFIHAEMEIRAQNVARRRNISPEAARQEILKIDKKRANYYNYYTNKKWGYGENYDLCFDSGKLGIEGSAALIKAFVEQWQANHETARLR